MEENKGTFFNSFLDYLSWKRNTIACVGGKSIFISTKFYTVGELLLDLSCRIRLLQLMICQFEVFPMRDNLSIFLFPHFPFLFA